MLNFRVILLVSSTVLSLVFSAPVDDERYITTTSRYYLPTTTSATPTRHYLPSVTVKPPRPGSHNSGSKKDSSNDDNHNYNNNKRPEFEKDNRLPHLPAENDEWEKWQKKTEEEKVKAWEEWAKIDSLNKIPTILDDDFTYWWFKYPYLHCPPYIRKYLS